MQASVFCSDDPKCSKSCFGTFWRHPSTRVRNRLTALPEDHILSVERNHRHGVAVNKSAQICLINTDFNTRYLKNENLLRCSLVSPLFRWNVRHAKYVTLTALLFCTSSPKLCIFPYNNILRWCGFFPNFFGISCCFFLYEVLHSFSFVIILCNNLYFEP